MRFSATFYALAAFIVSGLAAENPLHAPTTEIIAGEVNSIKWTSTTAGKVTLYLKQGKPTDLKTVSTIAVVEGSTGNFEWTPSTSLVPGSDYAIEIQSEKGEPNYTGLLTLKNDSATPSSSTESESSTASSSASSTSGSSSTSDSATSSTSDSATSSTSDSATSSMSDSITSSHASPTHHDGYVKPTGVYPPMVTGTGTPGYTSHHNVTYGNSTSTMSRKVSSTSASSTDSSSEMNSATSTGFTGKVSAMPPSPSDSSAAALMHSTMVLCACVFGAIMYLN